MPVRWRLTIWRGGGSPAIETVTQNLSSSGFYCLSPAPLTPGEAVRCLFCVPAHDPQDDERCIDLECRALVLRAEAAAEGFFGIACHIEEYHLGSGSADVG